MKKSLIAVVFIMVSVVYLIAAWNVSGAASPAEAEKASSPPVPAADSAAAMQTGYTGSSSCRACHERFYELWATSHHGLAMQTYTSGLGKDKLAPQADDIVVKKRAYRFVMKDDGAVVTETGPGIQKEYPVLYTMGGKNVYYFLTELDKGKLQVLPTAYDLNKKQWYDTAASGVRHFADAPDSPYHWTDYPYTFNTSCYSCHVSQMVNTYDLATDTYTTAWKESGINCETCHGPAEKHLQIAAAHPDGKGVEDWAMPIITPKYGYTAHQTNATCSNCHAKMSPLNANFKPGDDFFQHYDLVTYESRDYYPDGRDLGENYTYTSWRQSKCMRNSDLHCLTCHTSSGRYRFHDKETANQACMPCHASKVENFVVHARHKPKTRLTQCIQCHMPMTRFGNMNRSDHSMRPPMPAATIRFGSPNACNMCHKGQSPEWADKRVRRWHTDDYQAETLKLGTWIRQMRQQDYSDLADILAYIQSDERDEIFANSMIRLLNACSSPDKIPALLHVLKQDASPLCRSSAAEAFNGLLVSKEVVDALSEATADPYRLVRLRAAAVLAPVPDDQIPADKRAAVKGATKEFMEAMTARPDDAAGYFNLGNFYTGKNNTAKAISYFETSMRLRPDFAPAYINASMAYNQAGRNDKALATLDKVLELEPQAAAAHLNRALLLGEMGRLAEARKAFQATLTYDAKNAVAAYNLAVLNAPTNLKETLQWIRKASAWQPDNPKYVYTHAFYAWQAGFGQEAIDRLNRLVMDQTTYVDAYLLLADIYQQQNQAANAIEVYQLAADNPNLPEALRGQFRLQIEQMRQ